LILVACPITTEAAPPSAIFGRWARGLDFLFIRHGRSARVKAEALSAKPLILTVRGVHASKTAKREAPSIVVVRRKEKCKAGPAPHLAMLAQPENVAAFVIEAAASVSESVAA